LAARLRLALLAARVLAALRAAALRLALLVVRRFRAGDFLFLATGFLLLVDGFRFAARATRRVLGRRAAAFFFLAAVRRRAAVFRFAALRFGFTRRRFAGLARRFFAGFTKKGTVSPLPGKQAPQRSGE
jgi:hypothetical protein